MTECSAEGEQGYWLAWCGRRQHTQKRRQQLRLHAVAQVLLRVVALALLQGPVAQFAEVFQ